MKKERYVKMYNCEISAEYDIWRFDEDGNPVDVEGRDDHYVTRSSCYLWLLLKASLMYAKLWLKLPHHSIYSCTINRCDYIDI